MNGSHYYNQRIDELNSKIKQLKAERAQLKAALAKVKALEDLRAAIDEIKTLPDIKYAIKALRCRNSFTSKPDRAVDSGVCPFPNTCNETKTCRKTSCNYDECSNGRCFKGY